MTDRAPALLAVLRSATRTIRTAESVLRDQGITLRASEWDVLAFLDDLGPSRPSSLLRECTLTASPATLSTMLTRLEKRGFIRRMPDGTDSRSILVEVTPEGEDLIAEAWPTLAVKVVAPFNAHFTEQERTTLFEMLSRI